MATKIYRGGKLVGVKPTVKPKAKAKPAAKATGRKVAGLFPSGGKTAPARKTTATTPKQAQALLKKLRARAAKPRARPKMAVNRTRPRARRK